MCIVCVEWQSGKLTTKEALRNLGEMSSADGSFDPHIFEAVEKIMDKELPTHVDEEMDAAWQKEMNGE